MNPLATLGTLVDGGRAAAVWLRSPARSALRTPRQLERYRRLDHHRGRVAAARALASMGFDSPSLTSVGTDADGCPVWPRGFIGSISHTDSLAVAVVARADTAAAVGIDVERIRPRTVEFDRRVRRPEDGRGVPFAQSRALTSTAFFSLRESVYKCVFPTLRRPMDWADCELAVDWHRGSFRARILEDASLPHELGLRGYFRHTGVVFASVCWWALTEKSGERR